jgi:hypothetical protein
VLASAGDAITMNPYAIGVSPLHYQWRKSGVAIPGATGSAFNIASAAAADGGNYDLVVTNLYGSTTSAVSAVTIDRISLAGGKYLVDSKPSGPEEDAQNLGATWVASSTDALGTNRTGLMSFNGVTTNQIIIPAATNFDSATGTIMFWMRSPAAGAVPATLLDRRSGIGANSGHGVVIMQNTDGTIYVEADHFANVVQSSASTSDNNWHHVVLTYDQSESGVLSLYIDGVLDDSFGNVKAWSWQTGREIEVGASHDNVNWGPYDGTLDDVRVYNRILSDLESASAHTSGALVDTTALQLRLNFDAAPTTGFTLSWLSSSAILQSADSVTGPYVDQPATTSPYAVAAKNSKKFYRYRHTPVPLTSNPFLM